MNAGGPVVVIPCGHSLRAVARLGRSFGHGVIPSSCVGVESACAGEVKKFFLHGIAGGNPARDCVDANVGASPLGGAIPPQGVRARHLGAQESAPLTVFTTLSAAERWRPAGK